MFTSKYITNSKCPFVTESNMTNEELNEKIKELRKQLIVKKESLSKFKRARTSAKDDRTSAKSIGFVLITNVVIYRGIDVYI